MSSLLYAKNKLRRIYREPKECIYSHRFFEDLSSGYSYVLEDKAEKSDFLTFEPKNCNIAKLMTENPYYDLSYEIEQVIDCVTYSLMAFGKAYVHIIPKFTANIDNENKETKVLSDVKIVEIKGFIEKRSRTNIIFCQGFNGKIRETAIPSNQLIEFNITDLGFKKSYFRKILEKLEKCDISLSSTFMVVKNLGGYDFSVHSKKTKFQEMRASKDIGWSFGIDGLSDSYILYKKIQEDKLRIKFLSYILGKINCGFESFIGDAGGKLMAHIKEKDYDQLWNDYSDGKVAGTELTNILYNNDKSDC